jgi:hypothetical protein
MTKDTIELSRDFYPAVSATIECEADDTTYMICVYGFDGNLMYEEETNIYSMRDDEEDWIAKIGEFLCENWTLGKDFYLS